MLPEPYRIKVVEPIHLLSPKLREQRLAEADFNLFKVLAKDVYIDLLTDSGTGSQSDTQWAGIVRGDESYAGSRSYVRFEAAVKSIFGYPHVIAVHQGRAAEHVLFGSMLKPGMRVVANTHFDTTRANVEALEAVAVDLPDPESEKTSSSYPFKGNMDLVKLEEVLAREGNRVAVVIVTITNNSKGGQPVSIENVRGVRALCDRFGKPLIFDAARFAENCYFIKQREPGYADKSLLDIARELFALGDGAVVSLKKDGLANMGGVVTLKSSELTEKVRNLEILYEGYITYGGMSGRDLEAAAAGLEEVLNVDYLGHRVGQVAYLGEKLEALGIPTVRPYGGHAVFVDAGKFLPHIPPEQFPGHALAVSLYREGGIRAVEIGSLMFGTGEAQPASELVRLAIPRRVYTQSHLDYVVEIFARVRARKAELKGFEIVYEAPYLRHFTARLRECNAKSEPVGARP
jgi:tryptophanase